MHDDMKPLDDDGLKLAEFIQPTTNGKWVNIQYELEILQDYEGVCCSDSPRCTLRMFLQPPYLPNYGLVSAPAGWNPTIYAPVIWNLPNQIYYQTAPQVRIQGGQMYMEGGSIDEEESKEADIDD
jgi:hypothetical protein